MINGNAASGRTRGASGTVTNASTFLVSIWQAWSALAYGSGYGAANTEGYVTILHPRRAAWLAAGVSGTLPPGVPLVSGQLVVSAGIPSNAGAGTNEDVALFLYGSAK